MRRAGWVFVLLAGCGPGSDEEAIENLAEKDPETRYDAVRYLAVEAGSGPEVLDALIQAVADPDNKVQMLAAVALVAKSPASTLALRAHCTRGGRDPVRLPAGAGCETYLAYLEPRLAGMMLQFAHKLTKGGDLGLRHLARRAIRIVEEERERLLDESGFPLIAYVFTGFAPRQFLRLDPR